MEHFRRLTGFILLLVIAPQFLHAQEAGHVLSGLDDFIAAFFLGIVVLVFTILNFFVNSKWVNLITILLTLADIILLVTRLRETPEFVLLGLLFCLFAGISIYRNYRRNRLNP